MRRLARFAGGFCGAALGFALGLPLRWALAGAALAALAALALGLCRRRGAAILLAGIAAGLGWCAGDWALHVAPWQALGGQTREIRAEAADYSRKTAYGTATEVRLTVDGRTCRAILYGAEALSPGDRVAGRAALRTTGTRWGDDYLYHGARGYRLRATLRDGATVTPGAGDAPRYAPVRLAQGLKARLRALLPGDAGEFAAALVTGDTSGLSAGFLAQMDRAGTRHLVAVSGMHLGIILGALLLLLGHRQRLAAAIGLPLVWLFALAVGMTASVVRAAVMQSFLLAAPLLGRENDRPTSVLTALWLILLPNPRAILDVGLQLSFASVSGVLLFSRGLFRRMAGALPKGRFWSCGPVRAILSGVTSALSVMPLTLPLCLLHFGRFSLAAPVSSALLAPLVPVCFVLALAAGLGGVWMPLGTLLAWPLGWGIRLSMAVIGLTARMPLAAVSLREGYLVFFLAGLLALCVLSAAARGRCSLWVSGGCALSLLAVCLLLGMAEYDRAALSVTVLDEGQGVYVESGGRAAMFGCGDGRTAARFLESIGRRRLDVLAVRGPADDAAALLEAVSVERLYLPEADEDLARMAAARGCEASVLTADVALAFGSGALTLYAPPDAGPGRGQPAALCRCGGLEVLLLGGMDPAGEKRLAHSRALGPVEVVVADEAAPALLRLTEPQAVLLTGEAEDAPLSRAGVYPTAVYGQITIRR